MVPHMQVGHGQLPRTRRRGHRSTHPAEIGTDMVRRMSGCCSDPPHALGKRQQEKSPPFPLCFLSERKKESKTHRGGERCWLYGLDDTLPPPRAKLRQTRQLPTPRRHQMNRATRKSPLPTKKWGRGEKTLSVSLRLTLNELPQEICIPPLHGARLARKLSLL